MKYSEIIEAMNSATLFDLYRLREALNRMLDDPARLQKIKERLRVGDVIEYFDAATNKPIKARLDKIQRSKACITNLDDKKEWIIPLYWINLDSVDTQIIERKKEGLGRNEVAIGDTVGFVDNLGKEHYGKIIRINPKTVTIDLNPLQYRVAYCFLFKVLDQAADELPHHVNN